jgi:hypothetical protein
MALPKRNGESKIRLASGNWMAMRNITEEAAKNAGGMSNVDMVTSMKSQHVLVKVKGTQRTQLSDCAAGISRKFRQRKSNIIQHKQETSVVF